MDQIVSVNSGCHGLSLLFRLAQNDAAHWANGNENGIYTHQAKNILNVVHDVFFEDVSDNAVVQAKRPVFGRFFISCLRIEN